MAPHRPRWTSPPNGGYENTSFRPIGSPWDPDRRPPHRASLLLARLVGAALVLSATIPYVAWQLTPPQPMAMLVVDKTVPHVNYREHATLEWWMTHRRGVRPDGGVWRPDTDYVGYDPVHHLGRLLDSASLAGAHAVYVADAYGVYRGDYGDGFRETRADSDRTARTVTPRIFGGVETSEAHALAQFQRRGGAVVAEFNTLEAPTAGTPAADTLAAVLGARYLGWYGRWYADLADTNDILPWVRQRYTAFTARPWTFAGEGVVIVSERDARIVVVTRREFAQPTPLTIEEIASDEPLVDGVEGGHPYWYWFAGVTPTPGAVVLAWYHLHVTPSAAGRLARLGFPRRFPAVIRRQDTRTDGLGAYLAGDWADMQELPPLVQRTWGIDGLIRWGMSTARHGSGADMFWHVTSPIWNNILLISGADPR